MKEKKERKTNVHANHPANASQIAMDEHEREMGY